MFSPPLDANHPSFFRLVSTPAGCLPTFSPLGPISTHPSFTTLVLSPADCLAFSPPLSSLSTSPTNHPPATLHNVLSTLSLDYRNHESAGISPAQAVQSTPLRGALNLQPCNQVLFVQTYIKKNFFNQNFTKKNFFFLICFYLVFYEQFSNRVAH